jgi:omega-3 fatty acid desaturase (delta-15 desaturase)
MEEVPPIVPTLVEIKKILPKHCFQPTVVQSLYYVLKDLVIVTTLYLSFLCFENSDTYGVLKYLAVPLYWYLQGTMFWAIFVLGHDCGHESFSKYSLLNNVFGNILHR